MSTKEFELTAAVLRYAAACGQEGDWARLRDLGFGREETEAVLQLTVGELQLLQERLPGHVLKVTLDRTSFWAVVRSARFEADRHREKIELARRDAPHELMSKLYPAMDAREYAGYRRLVQAPRGIGRPPHADEETARTVWHAIERSVADPARGPESAAEWIAVADASGMSLRVIWPLVRDWTEESLFETGEDWSKGLPGAPAQRRAGSA